MNCTKKIKSKNIKIKKLFKNKLEGFLTWNSTNIFFIIRQKIPFNRKRHKFWREMCILCTSSYFSSFMFIFFKSEFRTGFKFIVLGINLKWHIKRKQKILNLELLFYSKCYKNSKTVLFFFLLFKLIYIHIFQVSEKWTKNPISSKT